MNYKYILCYKYKCCMNNRYNNFVYNILHSRHMLYIYYIVLHDKYIVNRHLYYKYIVNYIDYNLPYHNYIVNIRLCNKDILNNYGDYKYIVNKYPLAYIVNNLSYYNYIVNNLPHYKYIVNKYPLVHIVSILQHDKYIFHHKYSVQNNNKIQHIYSRTNKHSHHTYSLYTSRQHTQLDNHHHNQRLDNHLSIHQYNQQFHLGYRHTYSLHRDKNTLHHNNILHHRNIHLGHSHMSLPYHKDKRLTYSLDCILPLIRVRFLVLVSYIVHYRHIRLLFPYYIFTKLIILLIHLILTFSEHICVDNKGRLHNKFDYKPSNKYNRYHTHHQMCIVHKLLRYKYTVNIVYHHKSIQHKYPNHKYIVNKYRVMNIVNILPHGKYTDYNLQHHNYIVNHNHHHHKYIALNIGYKFVGDKYIVNILPHGKYIVNIFLHHNYIVHYNYNNFHYHLIYNSSGSRKYNPNNSLYLFDR